MAKRKVTKARLLVRYGEFRAGDTIKGDLAGTLVERGMAKDMTPSPTRKAEKAAARKKPAAKKTPAPENKDAGKAPENKGGEGFDPKG